MKLGLVWFNNDLRCSDQKILSLAAQNVDKLVCLYCDEPHQKRPSRYATQGMSPGRRHFLEQGLDDLALTLAALGQTLLVSQHNAATSLTLILNELPISHVYSNQQSGWDEQQTLEQVINDFPDVQFHIEHGATLFDEAQLPFSMDKTSRAALPHSFSAFRKLVEPLNIASPLPKIAKLPIPIDCSFHNIRPWKPNITTGKTAFIGGEKMALQHLEDYFSSDLPSHYKDVRNELDGWENSTKFSAWLAQGSLSAKQIKAALEQYENTYGANESTYWIYFELLWREYFYWYAKYYGNKLFLAGGLTNKRQNNSFYAERFRKWSQGNTPYPIVNACMKQLNQTGFMSNRGRQIAASCLVHELNIDWRYGAAYFEQQLIDYDVASNWGNWQYIAGVGADPRGGRRFNLEKQTAQYDPNRTFIQTWQGDDYDAQLDSVDASDWPISPTS